MNRPFRRKHDHERRFFHIGWPEGSTRRVLLLLVTAASLAIAAWARVLPQRVSYVEGDTATRIIRAPRSGVYTDSDETEKLRQEAANSVPDTYDADPNANHDALTALDDIFERFKEVRADQTLRDVPTRIAALRNLDIRLSSETLELAVSPTTSDTSLDRVHDHIAELVRREMLKEIRDNTEDLRKAREDLAENARSLVSTGAFIAMASEIGQAVLKNNRILNFEKTEKARQEKREAVKPVIHQIRVGEVIAFPNEEVRARHIAMFQAVGLMQTTVDYYQAAGILFTFILMVLLLGVFVIWVAPDVYRDFGQLIILAALLLVVAFAYRALEPTSWFESGALTVAVAVTMTVALVMNVLLATFTGVFLGVLLPIIAAGSDARLALVTVLCTTAGALAISSKGNKSSVVARAVPVMAVLDGVMMVAGGAVFGLALSPRMAGVAALGGLASPLLAMGASVALERLLGVTTDFRLMELSNSNEPILQRLIREAPGSYQSSVMVGNLAEPAAEAIGANALLVRTAAMYHDIGKIRRPYFFVENQFGGDNPHDRLSPHLSALVVISHIKDGLELADEYGLPPVIKQMIAEHQGTTLVKFFYQKALELADDAHEVQEGNFRYPGPRPQSRESGLLMLADTVEAAARTLENPSQQQIQHLVDRLIDDKIKDGQLDECPLSFKDLAATKRSFVSTLGSMFHQRVRYPDQIVKEAQRAEREAHRSRPDAPAPETLPQVQPPPPLSEDDGHEDDYGAEGGH